MNVLYITHYTGLEGGASLSLLYLMEEMQKKNVNVYLLVPYKNEDFFLSLRLKGIKVIMYRYDWWMKNKKNVGFFEYIKIFVLNYIAAYKAAKRVKQLDINIIHTNSSTINIGALINKFTGIPHVWHIREFGKEDYDLDFLYGKKYSMKFMDKYSSRIIAISKAIHDKYKVYFRDKLTIIYNGISKNYVNKKQVKQHKAITNILLAGSIMPGKGQLEAIMAVRKLVCDGYDNLHLHLAGLVNDLGYDKNLKVIVNENSLSGNIHFMEYQNDLKSLRQAADIELVCSRSEAFGRVTIEAMLSMNPVIGANTGGTKELIIDGYNGLLYKSGDYIDLAEKIKYLIDNNDKIGIMGENAFSFALENFTAERNAEEIYKIYSELHCEQ